MPRFFCRSPGNVSGISDWPARRRATFSPVDDAVQIETLFTRSVCEEGLADMQHVVGEAKTRVLKLGRVPIIS